jgi:hypothetical protein
MRETRPHRSNMNTEMSTENRGSILAWERGPRASECYGDSSPGNVGRPGRNAFQEPAEFIVGPHGRVGGGDPMNTNDLDGDFDAGPWDDAIQ